jgi:hypothetical protein
VSPIDHSLQIIKDHPSPIAVVPEEVLFKILVHLDFRSICRVGQVSRTWKQLANDHQVWQQTITCYFPHFPVNEIREREKEVCSLLLNEEHIEINCQDTLNQRHWTVKINARLPVSIVKLLLVASMNNGTLPSCIDFLNDSRVVADNKILFQELKWHEARRWQPLNSQAVVQIRVRAV